MASLGVPRTYICSCHNGEAGVEEKLALWVLDVGGVTFSARAATADEGGFCTRDSEPGTASPGVTGGKRMTGAILSGQTLLTRSCLCDSAEPAVLGPPAKEEPGECRSLDP